MVWTREKIFTLNDAINGQRYNTHSFNAGRAHEVEPHSKPATAKGLGPVNKCNNLFYSSYAAFRSFFTIKIKQLCCGLC